MFTSTLLLEYLVSNSVIEILKPLQDEIKRQMIVLPSQLNAAEHENCTDIPVETRGQYPSIKYESNTLLHGQGGKTQYWRYMYQNDTTGGPQSQLIGSEDVAKKIIRYSAVYDLEKYRPDLPTDEQIQYMKNIKYICAHIYTRRYTYESDTNTPTRTDTDTCTSAYIDAYTYTRPNRATHTDT